MTNGTLYTFEVLAENGVGEGPGGFGQRQPGRTPGAPQNLATDRQDGNGFLELT